MKHAHLQDWLGFDSNRVDCGCARRSTSADLWRMWQDERVCHKHALSDRLKSKHNDDGCIECQQRYYTQHEVGYSRFRWLDCVE